VPDTRICSAVSSALLLVAAGCAGSDLILPTDGAPAVQVVDGNNQQGKVGEPLDLPVIVEVRDASGNPLPDATVQFVFTSAGQGGEISPPSGTTDEAGRAEAHLLLGDKVGFQTGEAHLMVDGATASKAVFSAVAAAATPGNRAPTADFNWHCNDLSCQFTDASTDGDGNVTQWSWQFGDDEESDQANPSHVYPGPGTYTVTLEVSDDDGATDQTVTQVEVSSSSPPPAENQAPHAEFEVNCHDRFCSFTDKSEDEDGSVVSWAWDFGDGSSSDQPNPFHFYQGKGHYDVTLTVTDNQGATGSNTHHADPKH
jgi:PKD repeat protein